MIIILIVLIAGFLIWDYSESRRGYDKILIGNSAEVAQKIRTGLVHRAYKLHITFRAHTNDEGEIKSLVDTLLEEALQETDDPSCGDYIRYQLGGYRMNYDVQRELLGYRYKLELMPTYYSTAEQEEYVDEEVGKIVSLFRESAVPGDIPAAASENAPEEERVRFVHDYVTELLSYDRVHKDNKNSHGKVTAYAALLYHQAVCQGYAVLTYRLLRELGVSCRIVTGDAVVEGVRERHAWLEVNVDGRKLCLDPTLDDVNGCYDWYLKTPAEFEADHQVTWAAAPDKGNNY